jgi:hypothetical protein|tara:strand:- start:153 stop:416 length:264 start_codon:yes stop_codon:yes gene_type:complete
MSELFYKIEKGIPVPKVVGKYDFLKNLDEGDSFLVSTVDEIKSIRRKCSVINKRVIQRKEEAKYRLWIFEQEKNPQKIDHLKQYTKV